MIILGSSCSSSGTSYCNFEILRGAKTPGGQSELVCELILYLSMNLFVKFIFNDNSTIKRIKLTIISPVLAQISSGTNLPKIVPGLVFRMILLSTASMLKASLSVRECGSID